MATSTLPAFEVVHSPDGTVQATGSFLGVNLIVTRALDHSVTVQTATDPAFTGAINWAAILQAIVAALPAIMAIIAAFTGTAPAPKP
jgi:hypothetical protein